MDIDYSELTTVELTAVSTALPLIEEVLADECLPEGFYGILRQYMELDQQGRMEAVAEMSKIANFRAYAEWLGNGDAAPALLKVADELASMKPRELAAVSAGGLGAVAAISGRAAARAAQDA